ncbi:Uncharacterised protein [Neisseria meningitidis]|nr:Uncharacterised protein [Neisseria meningitidis]
MMQTFRKISLYAATLWLGMQIMAGYIAAPVLFKMLPKMQAGEMPADFSTSSLGAGLPFGARYWLPPLPP